MLYQITDYNILCQYRILAMLAVPFLAASVVTVTIFIQSYVTVIFGHKQILADLYTQLKVALSVGHGEHLGNIGYKKLISENRYTLMLSRLHYNIINQFYGGV